MEGRPPAARQARLAGHRPGRQTLLADDNHASIGDVAADFGPIGSRETLERLDQLAATTGIVRTGTIVSAASGAHARTEDEKAFMAKSLPGISVRGVATATGHLKEAQFPLAVALAALSLSTGEPIPPLDRDFETETTAPPSSVGVVCVGFSGAEGVAVLTAETGDAGA